MTGIYAIMNLHNKKLYIGQSIDIESRWKQHFSELRRGTHHNRYLQAAYNKYGADSFVVAILELCDKAKLNEREAYWVAKENSYGDGGYNLSAGGAGTPNAQRARKTFGDPYTVPVVCLNTGDVFPTYASAAEHYHLQHAGIRACAMGTYHSCGERNGERLVWARYDDYIQMTAQEISECIRRGNLPQTGANGSRAKAVVCIDTDEVFACISDAVEKYNININSIISCCRGRYQSAAGFAWAYLDDFERMTESEISERIARAHADHKRARNPHAKSVLCVDTGEVFACMSDACEKYNIRITCLSNCLHGYFHKAGGMEWQFYAA